MSTRACQLASLLVLATLAPATATAHPGHGAGDLMAGVLHPLTGLDHVLMIVAVSAWAALLPAWNRVAVTACMALFVGLGALLPIGGSAVLEGAIAVTVIGAGVLLAIGRRLPLWAASSLAAAFALIHGVAHGAEGPGGSLYLAGLIGATAAIALGVSFAVARLQLRPVWWKAVGVGSAAAGVYALAI